MSETREDGETAGKRCASESCPIDKNEIIDVSALDFDDTDAWLYIPPQCQTEPTVHDIYAWLKSEPELALPSLKTSNRRCIDTRTFTRPKKRTSRTSFESIFEGLSPSAQNVWRNQCSNYTNVEDASKISDLSIGKKDDVPPMLKTIPTVAANLLSEESARPSGQESMEVFLNMSHSKGIDSFINLTEPGFGDPLMNVSQPSIFYSSITSLSKDDSLHNSDLDGEERMENLADSISRRMDRLEEMRVSNNINETFSRTDSALDNKTFCASPADRTFTNKSDVFGTIDLNETYNAEAANNTLVLSGSDKDRTSTINLSSKYTNKYDVENKSPKSQIREKKDSIGLDATYLSREPEKKEAITLDATYLSAESENKNTGLDLTIGSNARKELNETRNIHTSANFDPPKPIVNSTPISKPLLSAYDDALDSTFKLPIPHYNQSTPKNAEALNSTFKTIAKHLDQSRAYNAALCSNFKAPTSLRRELLAEIHRSGERRLDSTYNHVTNDHFMENDRKENIDTICDQNIKNDIPIENKYNTYKKESSGDRVKSRNETVNSDTGACAQKDFQDRKFYTFTKKGGTYGGKTDMENAQSLEEVDATFVKPFPKLQKRKPHIPRMLSKLPQFLQKSNPNLVSNSLKTVGVTGCTNASNIGYMKGSQPNIVRDVEKSLTNKLYSLGKMKSGSEQRLLELNSNAVEFQMTGAGGSTESIESTQSAHSAPDLDDRLSTCSDSSHNSYTAQTMNIEQLHQIVRMQEESLKQESTPKLNRRVLENTWIDGKKDLPSPILKNGIDGCESDSSSPVSMDFGIKTSSPLLSPTGSSQSINNDGHPIESVMKQNETMDVKKVEVSIKPTGRIENKTRLRQPTNWNAAIRPSNTTSAIPRPPSRIPALRFTRPAARNPQADVKRGYM